MKNLILCLLFPVFVNAQNYQNYQNSIYHIPDTTIISIIKIYEVEGETFIEYTKKKQIEDTTIMEYLANYFRRKLKEKTTNRL